MPEERQDDIMDFIDRTMVYDQGLLRQKSVRSGSNRHLRREDEESEPQELPEARDDYARFTTDKPFTYNILSFGNDEVLTEFRNDDPGFDSFLRSLESSKGKFKFANSEQVIKAYVFFLEKYRDKFPYVNTIDPKDIEEKFYDFSSDKKELKQFVNRVTDRVALHVVSEEDIGTITLDDDEVKGIYPSKKVHLHRDSANVQQSTYNYVDQKIDLDYCRVVMQCDYYSMMLEEARLISRRKVKIKTDYKKDLFSPIDSNSFGTLFNGNNKMLNEAINEEEIYENDSSFAQLSTAAKAFPNPTDIYNAAKKAMEFYRREVSGNQIPGALPTNSMPLTIQKDGYYYELSKADGTNIVRDRNAMKVWNKLAFYGSYRTIGQWIHKDMLSQNAGVFEVKVKFRDDTNQPSDNDHDHSFWVGYVNSYVSLVPYAGGKTYPALTGANSMAVKFNVDHMKCDNLYGYHAYDRAVIDSTNIISQYVRDEVLNLEQAYIAQTNDEGRLGTLQQQVHERITPEAFASCYLLYVDTNNHPTTTCNIRVFELFSAVAVAEVHRNSYTAVVNAAMLDLFAADQKHGGDEFEYMRLFFGEKDANDYYTHNMAFGGATATATNIDLTAKNNDGTTLRWNEAKLGGLVAEREKTITESWIKLLYHYECWLLMNNKVDAVDGGVTKINNVNNFLEHRINFGVNCDDNTHNGGAWDFEDGYTRLRPELKIYGVYRTVQKINNWQYNDATHDNAIRDHIHANILPGVNPNGQLNPLYLSVIKCIQVDYVNVCGGLVAIEEQLICMDVYCGLLAHNTMEYIDT